MTEDSVITKQVSSFTLKQTAKGEYYWEIKIYSDDVEVCKKKIVELDQWARKEYGAFK